MKYWAVVCDTDAPRRPELGPEVDAAPKPYSAQDVSEKSFPPGRHGRGLRCGILARRFHKCTPIKSHLLVSESHIAASRFQNSSFQRLLAIFDYVVLKENDQDGECSLKDDRYRPSGSGIAVYDAGIYPCGCTNCYGTSQDVDYRS